ncbi:RidA family protein [Mesorhizobium sp. YM1C-6-2]|jgi:enamine deaminase RidA (YjgF/YER057c/UK114 family)|uniref:RidA family protein n=1 Tax=Mesorhizobium sp. YM1C-6-2 TaxID=1827501 RepID=UPI000EF22397|nr:RidA family protein [Mesorhizobium sp. YM1C-6-2]RLP26995.1 RidA family protein [Mesorhizobium sp. YM1C-6-2]
MTGGQGPKPQGDYVPATRNGNLIFTSGMTPRKDGVMTLTGPVKVDEPLDTYKNAVLLACGNALAAARSMLGSGERITAILSLTVYVAAEPGFTAHSRLADFASAFLRSELGTDGIGSRAAVGVATLPGNAPVEIQLVAAA